MLVQILKTNKVRNLKDTTAKLLIDRKMARAIDEVDEATNKKPAKTNKKPAKTNKKPAKTNKKPAITKKSK